MIRLTTKKQKLEYDPQNNGVRERLYEPLTVLAFVLCIIGIILGAVFVFYATGTFIRSATNPKNPHSFSLFGDSNFNLTIAFYEGIATVVLFSICIPKLIFRTHINPPNKIAYRACKIVLPLILSIALISGYAASDYMYNNGYREPTFEYGGAQYSYYYEFPQTVVTGLALDSASPQILKIPEVIYSHDVDKIDEGAFKDNTTITEVVIPDSVQTIDAYAFSGCTNLRKVTLGKSIRYINECAFEKSYSLAEINEPVESSTKNFLGLTVTYVCEIDQTAFRACPLAPSWTKDSRYSPTEKDKEE